MDARSAEGRFNSRLAAGAAAAAAVAWAALAAFHPPGFEAVARAETTGMWLTVHYGQLVLAPLVALAVLHLLRELTGVASSAARVAVVLWVAWFSAFDAIAGIASGVLVDLGTADAALGLFDHGVVGGAGSVLGFAAQGMWLLVAAPAGLSLRAAGASRLCYVAMFVSALVVFHAGPAVVGFVALGVAFWAARPPRSGELLEGAPDSTSNRGTVGPGHHVPTKARHDPV